MNRRGAQKPKTGFTNDSAR